MKINTKISNSKLPLSYLKEPTSNPAVEVRDTERFLNS